MNTRIITLATLLCSSLSIFADIGRYQVVAIPGTANHAPKIIKLDTTTGDTWEYHTTSIEVADSGDTATYNYWVKVDAYDQKRANAIFDSVEKMRAARENAHRSPPQSADSYISKPYSK